MKKVYFIIICLSLMFTACQTETNENTDQKTEEELKTLADELAHKFIITDGHVDLPYRLRTGWEDVSQRTEEGDFDYVRAKEGGLDAPFMSIYIPSRYEEEGAREVADTLINLVESIVERFPDKFAMAYNTEDIKSNFEQGLISLPMGMENGAPIEGDLANLKYFYDRGIRYVTLTHARDNHISDSSYDTTRTWNGLSPFGEGVVKEMNRLGIMVDISHVSDSAFYDVMEITDAPAIASHSSCRAFTPGWERNMSDEMIKKLAENGGVIQINFGSTFLDSASRDQRRSNREHIVQWLEENGLERDDSVAENYIEQYYDENPIYTDVSVAADHIDHVVNLTSIDHVAFGSDFDGVGDSLPYGLKDVSDYPNLIFELLKRGYTEEDIRKICYENVFRVWNEVENIANKMQSDLAANSN